MTTPTVAVTEQPTPFRNRAARRREEQGKPELFDSNGLASYLQVTERTLAAWRAKGIGPRYARVGGKCVRYRIADVDAWLASGGDPA